MKLIQKMWLVTMRLLDAIHLGRQLCSLPEYRGRVTYLSKKELFSLSKGNWDDARSSGVGDCSGASVS